MSLLGIKVKFRGKQLLLSRVGLVGITTDWWEIINLRVYNYEKKIHKGVVIRVLTNASSIILHQSIFV